MNLIQSLLFFVIISLGFTNCNLINYQYMPPPPSQEEVNSKIIKDSISSILTSQLREKYSPFNFGKITTNKPKEFIRLDSIYKERSTLTKRKKKYEEDYEQKLKILNDEISKLKTEINQKRLYHTYQMDHIYIVKTSKGFTLHEDQFHFLPNFKLKKISPLLSTPLTPKEKVLFEYFSFEYPLFETEDVNYNHQMDQFVYQKFNNALAVEKKNNARLIHTILYSIEYIRKYNSFDHKEIAKGIANKWIIQNQPAEFKPEFEPLEEIKEDDYITSYLLTAKNKNGNQSITFNFDLNLVITDTILK